ncbi:MAG: terminase TerL endonuclease subunit, partial [Pseudomonadota bacterium]
SVFAALSADASTKQGLSPSFVVYDELGSATGRALFDALDTAMGAREDPLFLVISTQAATDAAPMSELVDYGLQVQAGAVEDQSFKLFFYSAPMDADPWSEEAWRLANPALDDFLSLAEVKRQAGQAQRIPSKEAAFRNLILNQRVSADAQFLTVTEWMRNAAAPDLESLAGKTCYAGLDLSASRDLTALVLAFPDEDGHFDVVPFFWLPGDGLIDREHEDRMPYGTWKRQGQLLTTPGNTIDPGFVAAKLAELEGLYDIRALGYDRWRIEAFKRELDQIGSEVPLEEFGQGYKDMAPAVDLLERLVAEGRLRHGSHPILTWNIANTVVTPDPAGNRKLDKARSRGRIDGAVALAMALSVAEKHSSEDGWEPFVMVV